LRSETAVLDYWMKKAGVLGLIFPLTPPDIVKEELELKTGSTMVC
jgi:hypothetical protein